MITSRRERRAKRQYRNRKNISGTLARPRLVVFASNDNITAQIIDDTKKHTIVAMTTVGGDVEGSRGTQKAYNVGVAIAKKALEANVKAVVFDRAGFAYHGRVKALADGAREGGLDF